MGESDIVVFFAFIGTMLLFTALFALPVALGLIAKKLGIVGTEPTKKRNE
jgi:hypothetical protein